MTVERTDQPALRVHLAQTGPTAVRAALVGDLDAVTVDVLRTRILDTLDQRQPDRMVLDLAGLDFIGVSGVRALCEMHAAAAVHGCALTISNSRESTRWLLTMMAVDQLFLEDR